MDNNEVANFVAILLISKAIGGLDCFLIKI